MHLSPSNPLPSHSLVPSSSSPSHLSSELPRAMSATGSSSVTKRPGRKASWAAPTAPSAAAPPLPRAAPRLPQRVPPGMLPLVPCPDCHVRTNIRGDFCKYPLSVVLPLGPTVDVSLVKVPRRPVNAGQTKKGPVLNHLQNI